MYTANTMASAIETLGMSVPASSSLPAESPAKMQECLDAGGLSAHACWSWTSSRRDILTRAAFENAMVMITVLGGSTNAVLHLIAIAHAAGVRLTMD
ncbi:MAG: dihydroxy-acid dehydratase [Hymenobacter sp.]